MTRFDPIALGEYAQDSYATYLIGGNQRGYHGLLEGFQTDTASAEGTPTEFIRSKGPILQGVPAATWSETPWTTFARSVDGTFAPNGLEKPIIDAFTDEGFESLQTHQEEAIQWLVDDKHALIAAGTGRGKTEAWFIPILQYALRAKRGRIEGHSGYDSSIKAVITYPTKALAQDQLKRFIEYLWLVNEKTDLPSDQKLTIGVYDGDTPYRNWVSGENKDPFTYLIDSFKHFELPGTIAEQTAIDEATLEEVPPSVFVEKGSTTNEYRLKLREEYGGHRLDFVHLTRDKMHEDPPDILLTNPDTINYRLFNINDEQAHRMFVDQPKFLVFDEVHTYQGLFGAHVSMLVKRLRQLRTERGVEDQLRIIASSATIDEREVLFQRLFNVPTDERDTTYKLIEEATSDEVSGESGELPDSLTTVRFDPDTIDQPDSWSVEVREQFSDLGIDPTDGGELSEQVSAAVSDGSLQCVDHLHGVLQDPLADEYDIDAAPEFDDFTDYIERTYGCNSAEATRAAHNVLVLFGLAGYELRAHVLNWPVDGYYKCLHCHQIYSKPKECDCEGHEHSTSFVTKLRLCQDCGEQVYEAWLCPDCGTVRPVTQETEGEYLYASKPECNHPKHAELQRVYWTPEYQCASCGTIERLSDGLGYCACGGSLTRTTDGLVCKDPTCERENKPAESSCADCGGQLELLEPERLECSDPSCERHGDDQEGRNCRDCDSRLVPKVSLSWICSNENHRGHRPWESPGTCDCGRSTFVLPAYIDTQEADYCVDCNESRKSEVYHLAGTGCAIEGHDSIDREYSSFGLKAVYRDSDGNIRLASPGKASHALPCYHGRRRNYDSLMRSPTNAGVTMSQFMLRRLADRNGSQEQAKLMSFADSYRDMERLANDFDEPERKLFIQQRILSFLVEHQTATLTELLEGTLESARAYWNDIEASDDVIDDVIGYGQWRGTLMGQLLPGSYLLYNNNISRQYGELVNKGFVDISFAKPLRTPEERKICRELLEENRQPRQSLLKTIRESTEIANPVSVISDLKERGVLREDEEYDRIGFDLDAIAVKLVSDAHGIPYNPHYDTFWSTAEREVGKSIPETVQFTVRYTERADPGSPYFERTAYRAATTSPRLLLSQVYKGDVPADERRRIEHEFKHDPTPNFLSTGPAMEIGIDIGDLNTLLLMGTPPNTNAYLQRIGRAGRDVGKSLVTTVSKRNPIDFYYHKLPEKLISSAEKPVPLNQHNESVLRIALTWSVMDYIAARYHIPWERNEHVDSQEITKPDPSEWDRYRKENPRDKPPSDVQRFTQLYNKRVEQINHGSIFEVLQHIVEHDDGVDKWLHDLLDYVYCRNCQHIFSAETTGECTECSEGDLRHAREEFDELIDDVLNNFASRVVYPAYNYRSDLQSDLQGVVDEIDELEGTAQAGGGGAFGGGGFDELDSQGSDSEVDRRLSRLKLKRDMIQDLISEYNSSKFSDIHGRSAVSEYVPQLRAFGDSVAVTRRERSNRGTIKAESKSSWDRDSAMAIRELHPYAYVLRNKRGYVVTKVERDTEGTRALQEQTGGPKLRCRKCGFTTQWEEQSQCPDDGCDAGAEHLVKVESIAINGVELTEASVEENDYNVTDVYPLSGYNTNPRSTFGHTSTEIPEFEVERSVTFTGPDDALLFTVEQGRVEVVEAVTSFTTSYDDEQKDPREQPLRICHDRDCGSVVVPGADGTKRCLSDPTHDRSEQADVFVGRTFTTKGLRITGSELSDSCLHTLAHGFRLALQRTGGLDIRSLQEAFNEGDDEAFVFESAVGGNGVTDLLFQVEDDVHVELLDALTVMHQNITGCDCATGCPECLYQYGCSERNRDTTLAKDLTEELLDSLLSQQPEEIITG
ncbi:DEAD/DEAH box helicase [Salinigranum halophilum]|uniref:DEAD/DEAH box helicase n=1 Tax=Salinigranum halophilum TaxID=2565931 RepID=UPI00115EC151|nr:DEAD/DEAH box helicase [Salinigranum halophilum]